MERVKKGVPYLVVLAVFYLISYLFTPQVLRNEVVNQADIASWRGMANEIISYNSSNPDGDKALWTNSMFSGMPANSISIIYDGDYTDYLYRAIHWLFGVRPPSYFLISLVGGLLLFLAFGVALPLSAIGAFAITFCSYNMQIMQVGHNSKMVAIAFMPWVLAALVYAYRKKPLLGALLFGLALSFEIKANHPQISYYLAIIVVGFSLSEMVVAIKKRLFPKFLKTSLYLLVAGLLGIATNVNHLWPTYEYSKYTMRGGSELAKEEGKAQEGLDIAYATSWSYSPQESLNLMIPNLNGGASMGELSTKSETYKALRQGGYQGANQVIKQLPLYWGPQPFTAGPSYIGALTLFLFVMALLILEGSDKWWMAAVSLLALLLSWGSNFLPLTELFFNYAPLYNRFRTVSMILVVLQITLPLAAILLLQKVLVERSVEKKRVLKGVKIAAAITGGISLLFILFPTLIGSFSSHVDANLPPAIRESLVADRISLLRGDAFRSLLFILGGAALIWLTTVEKLKIKWAVAAVALLFFADLWFVGGRYLNSDHFIKSREFENQYPLRPVDRAILEDKEPHYRVLDLSVNTFNDSHISYHHKTIGGYSPAKLQLYQDLIERHLTREMGEIATALSDVATYQEAEEALGNYPALNMLNCRYIVIGAELPPLINRGAFGNGWFVEQIIEVGSLTEEIESLGAIGIEGKRAFVNESFSQQLKGVERRPLEEGEGIELIEYTPNRLKYRAYSSGERLALFSEIYYPAGWSATIDGESVEIIRANYLLRGVKVPGGEHIVEFKFKPESYVKGARYSSIASSTLLLLLLIVIIVNGVNFKKEVL